MNADAVIAAKAREWFAADKARLAAGRAHREALQRFNVASIDRLDHAATRATEAALTVAKKQERLARGELRKALAPVTIKATAREVPLVELLN